MANEKLYFTKSGYEELKQRQAAAEKKLRVLQAETAHAADVGGNQYHDNASYELLVNDIRAADGILNRIHEQLRRAVIVEDPRNDEKVAIGTSVTLRMNNSQKQFKIVGHSESAPEKGLIAYDTALARLIIGHEEGDEVRGVIGGKNVTIEIIKISI